MYFKEKSKNHCNSDIHNWGHSKYKNLSPIMDYEQSLNKLNSECNIGVDLTGVLTNGNVLSLYDAVLKSKRCTSQDVANVFKCDHAYLRNLLSNLRRKRGQLRGEQKRLFLNDIFSVKSQTEREEQRTELEKIVCDAQLQTLTDSFTEMKTELHENKVKHEKLKAESSTLKRDKKKLKHQVASLQGVLKRKRSKCSALSSYLQTKKTDRKNEMIFKLQNKNKELEKGATELSKKINFLNNSLQKSEQKVHSLHTELKSSRNRMVDLTEELDSEKQYSISTTDDYQNLKESVTYLESLLNDSQSNEVLVFDTDKQAYSNNMQLCVMNLLSEGVGVHHVNNVIQHVSQLCGKSVSHLPSLATINRIGDQRASISYMQIGESLGREKDTCLQSDETRKHGDCYEVFSVRDKSEKEWVIGLKDMINKSSQNCLQTLKTIIDDINESTKNKGRAYNFNTDKEHHVR